MPRTEVEGFSWRRLIVTNTVGGLIMPAILIWVTQSIDWWILWRTTVFSMTYAWSVGTVATVSFLFAAPFIGRCAGSAAWWVVLGVLTGAAFAGCFVATCIIMLLPMRPESWSGLFWSSLRFCVPIAIGIGVVFSFVEDSRQRLKTTTLQLKTRELERERAEKLAMEARLSSLESRVHPHFLFNALNSIASLIREDPGRAERLIERMASLLRYSLDAHRTGVVTLGQELKIVADYVEIEQARFGGRLHFDMDVAPQLHDYVIPAMSIQTLVENSVKYAVSPRREGGSITVRADRNGGLLRVTVEDDGPGFSPGQIQAGHGLDLLQSRLEAVFGAEAGLEVEAARVAIRVPAREGPAV